MPWLISMPVPLVTTNEPLLAPELVPVVLRVRLLLPNVWMPEVRVNAPVTVTLPDSVLSPLPFIWRSLKVPAGIFWAAVPEKITLPAEALRVPAPLTLPLTSSWLLPAAKESVAPLLIVRLLQTAFATLITGGVPLLLIVTLVVGVGICPQSQLRYCSTGCWRSRSRCHRHLRSS